MRTRFVKVAAPFWAATYFVIFYLFGVPIFLFFEFNFGVWLAALVLTLMLGVWGVIFYIILLQTDSFEHFRVSVGNLLKKQHGKVFETIRKKYFDENDHSSISPVIIMLAFLFENPLLGVPLIRYSFPRNAFLKGFFWVWIGAIIKVSTWYLPIYGGGISIFRSVLHFLHLG